MSTEEAVDKQETTFQLEPCQCQTQGELGVSYTQLFIQPDVTFVFFTEEPCC